MHWNVYFSVDKIFSVILPYVTLHIAYSFSLCYSAGKSFVAEILMLRRVLSSGKMALLVLPYVSICAEKVCFLSLKLTSSI